MLLKIISFHQRKNILKSIIFGQKKNILENSQPAIMQMSFVCMCPENRGAKQQSQVDDFQCWQLFVRAAVPTIPFAPLLFPFQHKKLYSKSPISILFSSKPKCHGLSFFLLRDIFSTSIPRGTTIISASYSVQPHFLSRLMFMAKTTEDQMSNSCNAIS